MISSASPLHQSLSASTSPLWNFNANARTHRGIQRSNCKSPSYLKFFPYKSQLISTNEIKKKEKKENQAYVFVQGCDGVEWKDIYRNHKPDIPRTAQISLSTNLSQRHDSHF